MSDTSKIRGRRSVCHRLQVTLCANGGILADPRPTTGSRPSCTIVTQPAGTPAANVLASICRTISTLVAKPGLVRNTGPAPVEVVGPGLRQIQLPINQRMTFGRA